ncbi:MAG: L-threonylcarbamoyladenylate synthase [Pseudomonadota bacterium]
MTAPAIVDETAHAIVDACDALAHGSLVGLPTETVYGLAADATNPQAVARVFAAKGRPAFNPLIAHVASTAMACREGVLDERAQLLAETFWPGPLTLVVPVHAEGHVCELARAGLQTIALRVPAHRVARSLLGAYGKPLAAPSANPSGKLSPTSARDVAHAFGEEVAMVIDGGSCEAGIESTIVGLLPSEPARLLRPGIVSRDALLAYLPDLVGPTEGAINAPGQLSSHYAPGASVRLGAQKLRDGEVMLGFGPDAPANSLNLSPRADLVEAAANLYRMLRQLDQQNPAGIAVMPVPEQGLGEAINDRLRRAAAPRN